jgi:PPOX class probable F420-dependent enzyme
VEEWVLAALASADHGILVTVVPDGSPRPVPFTFALLDDRIVGAVDHKPKSTMRLARLADLQRTGHATVLVEHYEEDWRRLWWVRVTGQAEVHDPGDPSAVDALVAKYDQ